MNQRERKRLATELMRAYEIINDALDFLERPIAQREQEPVHDDLTQLRELVWALWQDFELSTVVESDEET